MTEIRISPQAKVLPPIPCVSTYIFRGQERRTSIVTKLWLLNDEEQVVPDPFLVLSQELWSVDGRRLNGADGARTDQRGLGADPSHDPALVVGRAFSLVVTALGRQRAIPSA